MAKSLNGGRIYPDDFWNTLENAAAEPSDKNFRVMAETSFRNKMSRRSNSAGRGIYDRAHQVIVAPSRELLWSTIVARTYDRTCLLRGIKWREESRTLQRTVKREREREKERKEESKKQPKRKHTRIVMKLKKQTMRRKRNARDPSCTLA